MTASSNARKCPCSTYDGTQFDADEYATQWGEECRPIIYGPHSDEMHPDLLRAKDGDGILPPFRVCTNHRKYYTSDRWKVVNDPSI